MFTGKNIRTILRTRQKKERELQQLVQNTISPIKCSFRLCFMSLDSIALCINKPGHGQPLSVSNLAIFSLGLFAPPCIPETVLSERSQIWAVRRQATHSFYAIF